MSDSKRQKNDPSLLEFTVSIRGQGIVDVMSLPQFVECGRVASAKRTPVANTQTRVLKLTQTVFPQAILVDWREYGGIEDVEFSQYYEGSRHDLEYSLYMFIGSSIPRDLKCEDAVFNMLLTVCYLLSTETTDEKVYFEFKERFLDFTITNWQTDAVNPTPTQVRELLLSIVDQEVANPMKKYINEQINELNMDAEMKKPLVFI